jgi:hypothetical protein
MELFGGEPPCPPWEDFLAQYLDLNFFVKHFVLSLFTRCAHENATLSCRHKPARHSACGGGKYQLSEGILLIVNPLRGKSNHLQLYSTIFEPLRGR